MKGERSRGAAWLLRGCSWSAREPEWPSTTVAAPVGPTRRVVLASTLGALAGCASGAHRNHQAPLRVVTWNIRHGAGKDGRVDLVRTARVLAALEPDLVLLQEVDRGCRRSGGVDQAAELGVALGMTALFGAHREFDGGEYGLAILSRLEPVSSRTLPLTAAPRPLIALEARWRVPGSELVSDRRTLLEHADGAFEKRAPRPHRQDDPAHGMELRTVCVHLVDTVEERTAEARAVRAALEAEPGPALVAGDFNGPRATPPLDVFEGWTIVEPTAPRDTFPADAPVREIDFVVLSPDLSSEGAWVVPETEASDHRPVVTSLRPFTWRSD